MSHASPAKRASNRLQGLWQEIHGRVEFRLLLAVLLVGLATWLFIHIAEEVMEGDTRAIDTQILLAMRNPADHADPLGPPWVEEMGRDFTALGGLGVIGLVTGATSLYLA